VYQSPLAHSTFRKYYVAITVTVFCDVILKNFLVLYLMKKSLSYGMFSGKELVPLISIVYLIPYICLSIFFTQIIDQNSKTTLLKKIKYIELVISSIAVLSMYSSYLFFMLFSLLSFGILASITGPLKLSMISEIVDKKNILPANSIIQSTNFVISLASMIVANYLFHHNELKLLVFIYLIPSILSVLYISNIEKIDAIKPEQNLDTNVFKLTMRSLKSMYKTKGITSYVINISLFWFMGGILISIIPPYITLFTDNNDYITFFLCFMSIGIAFGAIIYQSFFNYIEKGALIFCNIFICIFLLDLFYLGQARLDWPNYWWIRTFFDLTGISIFSGMIIVAFYTSLQLETTSLNRTLIIAGTNVVSSSCMMMSSVFVLGSYFFRYDVLDVFVFLFYVVLFNVIILFRTFPEHFYRYVCEFMSFVFYKFSVEGRENIPKNKSYIVICNHVSFIDWMFINTIIKRPMRFVMYFAFSNIFTSWLFNDVKVILISEKGKKRSILINAFKEIDQVLKNREILGYFPEGQITKNGEMADFKKGIEKILEKNDVPILPMKLNGLWGSVFSRYGGKAFSRKPKLERREVQLVIGKLIYDKKTKEELYEIVKNL